MICKTFEFRDKMTFIPVLAVKLEPNSPADNFLFMRAGYGFSKEEQCGYVGLAQIDGGRGQFATDPYDWGQNRTMHYGHLHVNKHFDELQSGSVVDVEFLLGESGSPKLSEAYCSNIFR